MHWQQYVTAGVALIGAAASVWQAVETARPAKLAPGVAVLLMQALLWSGGWYSL
jgi:hypothetical protein